MTLSGLIEFLTTEYGLELSMLSSGMGFCHAGFLCFCQHKRLSSLGVSILFSDFMNRKKLEVSFARPLFDRPAYCITLGASKYADQTNCRNG